MKKLIYFTTLTFILSFLSACSKSSSGSGGTCFECTINSIVVKYCKKNETTATITSGGVNDEDTFSNGWDQYVKDTKDGVASIGGTCN